MALSTHKRNALPIAKRCSPQLFSHEKRKISIENYLWREIFIRIRIKFYSPTFMLVIPFCLTSSGVSCWTLEFTQNRTEPFTWTTGVGCSGFVNHDLLQLLIYIYIYIQRNKYSFVILPFGGIEPATCRRLHSKAPLNQTLYPQWNFPSSDNSKGFSGIIKFISLRHLMRYFSPRSYKIFLP